MKNPVFDVTYFLVDIADTDIYMRVSTVAFSTILVLAAQDLTLMAGAFPSSFVSANLRKTGSDGSQFVVMADTGNDSTSVKVPPEKLIAQVSMQPLADLQGHWAKNFIQPLVNRGIFSPFSDGKFYADMPINRAEFATIISQAFARGAIREKVNFSDVTSNYPAYSAIQKAYQMGFVNSGYNNQFNPTQNITRAEVLVALVQGLNLTANNIKANSLQSYFDDAASIPDVARGSIAAAIENRLVVNYPNLRLLNPNQPATRAEVAAFIYQALVKTGQMPPLSRQTIANQPQNNIGGNFASPLPNLTTSPAVISVAQPPAGFNTLATISALEAQETDYTLGGGDRIRLDILNVPEYSGEYQVLVNGVVNLPLIGKVDIKGMTLDRAALLISDRYSYYIKKPIATISLVSPRPLKVAISGEVNRPGSYTMSLASGDGKGGIQFPTVTQALQMAGGINQAANLRQVLVRRPQKNAADQIIGIDLWALLQKGDLRQDITLKDGDTIFIPTAVNTNLAEAPRVASSSFAAAKTEPLNIAVVGEVSKPGSYTIKVGENGERPTLIRALREAGGITQSADISQIQIRRPTQTGSEQLIAVNLWQLLRAGDLQQDVILQQGDRIVIPTASDINLAQANQLVAANFSADQTQPVNISVVGEVTRPGTHVVKVEKAGELPTVTRAIQVAGGITQLADIRKIQVRRITREGSEKTISVDLWQLLQSGDGRQDAILQTGDTIVIPTAVALNETEATQLASASFSPSVMTVNVVGEVMKPGPMQLPPNTPLNQAILASGGFNNRARKGSVELIRLNPNGTVSKQSVDIDFEQGINEQNNPTLRPNDVVVVGKSGLASVSDTLGTVLNPIGGLFSLFNFFKIFQ